MSKTDKVVVYDTTLRDGAQSEGVSFSVADKLEIVKCLDNLEVDYIEGGFPSSNPKDIAFFEEVRKVKLKHARVASFGSTRRVKSTAADDEGLSRMIATKTPVCTIFGKTWDLHVEKVLKTDLDTNLQMIADSVKRLKRARREVIYDAEHFFDGYRANPEYAVKTLEAAAEAGAACLVLCDTNGGMTPLEMAEIVRTVAERFDVPLGIHNHNDAGMGDANSVAAVQAGCRHVQGTLNGLGERCGNADLCVVIPTLELKAGYRVLGKTNLKKLTEVSRFVYELLNAIPRGGQPYVGRSAFAHKAGMHVAGVTRDSKTFEHISPEAVGNTRRILISELSGGSTILAKTEKLDVKGDKALTRKVLAEVTRLEEQGYQFEAAEASFELMVRRLAKPYDPFFELEHYRVINEIDRDRTSDTLLTEATVKLRLEDTVEHHVAEGDGPVNALDGALRKALVARYPQLDEMQLIDYKVRIINPKAGTAAKVRVIIGSRDHDDVWSTVGVSENIIEASWLALVDAVEYKLLKD